MFVDRFRCQSVVLLQSLLTPLAIRALDVRTQFFEMMTGHSIESMSSSHVDVLLAGVEAKMGKLASNMR